MARRKAGKFEDIIDLLVFLRSPGGCPWDRSKDAKDLKPYLLEECHELMEAIDSGETQALVDELGDLLLHCAFLTAIGQEGGIFTSRDVFERLEAKIRRRHPHLFPDGESKASPEGWESIKQKERQRMGRIGISEGIPATLPPLLKAFRIQERAAAWKFDWSSPDGALLKGAEERGEVEHAYRSGDRPEAEQEIGDLLFAVVNLSRLLDIHPEDALSKTIRKFARRFDRLAVRATECGLVLGEASLEELDRIWEAIKKEEDLGEEKDTRGMK
ncbi:MAG: hypothetical protein A2Z06_00285 [Candidatus Glassbacteria bacterium RBG_16_58_8]|uniref:NTP pyrophosphohydrolase MazG-like domain-containing protein n=1 Tax=Candidatus Glassbacteria bacterium RBG_16_58_8 TaxID=1817866 RepID=A0A1F5YD21_9BACT|nr:MAG: hypothetical protein A2Z06_00285 [Candidatus Glassbacteria bacterium RBG_16_58_8]